MRTISLRSTQYDNFVDLRVVGVSGNVNNDGLVATCVVTGSGKKNGGMLVPGGKRAFVYLTREAFDELVVEMDITELRIFEAIVVGLREGRGGGGRGEENPKFAILNTKLCVKK